jgi:hypothetical protein
MTSGKGDLSRSRDGELSYFSSVVWGVETEASATAVGAVTVTESNAGRLISIEATFQSESTVDWV